MDKVIELQKSGVKLSLVERGEIRLMLAYIKGVLSISNYEMLKAKYQFDLHQYLLSEDHVVIETLKFKRALSYIKKNIPQDKWEDLVTSYPVELNNLETNMILF